ncbi:hypothetical protein ACFP1I_19990 [Dyadobacter subterraneus]|uniref:Uncharacterized protein n=1 Tax=Dyadobacter subterraneus TaxID=2773304 RepID=A0ABR9W8Z3_9BACT|nr:hypothetical protein [Dyadobacter subterraneus]MBE9460866.1 hypothetical protein [Dyadobacter subterraneus]
MIEVFKTNVTDREVANMLLDQIHLTFVGYQANFDLEDCDKILRVCFDSGIVQSSLIISLLRYFKFEAEVLPENHRSPAEQILLVK